MSAPLLSYPTHHRSLPRSPAPLLGVTPDGSRPLSAMLLLCLTHHRSLPRGPAPLRRVTADGSRPLSTLVLCLTLAATAPTLAPTQVLGARSPSGPILGTQAPPGAAVIADAVSRNSPAGGGHLDSASAGTRATAPVAGPEPPACTVPLEAARSVQVCALRSAPVVRIAAEPGDAVGAGDTLVWLDDRELCLAVGRARLAYQDLAARLQRAVPLHAQGGLSTQDLETLRFQVETAQFRWEQTRLELSRATIQAPMSGVVSECAIQVGDLTHPGQVLCRVIDPADLKATLYLPAEWLRRLRPGQIVRGRVLAEPGVAVKGTIRRLGPGLDPSSGCAPVEVLFPRAGRQLRPGTLVQVQLVPE